MRHVRAQCVRVRVCGSEGVWDEACKSTVCESEGVWDEVCVKKRYKGKVY